MGWFPFPRSSDPSATTIDLPIMSVTLTSLSANLNSARPLSSAIITRNLFHVQQVRTIMCDTNSSCRLYLPNYGK